MTISLSRIAILALAGLVGVVELFAQRAEGQINRPPPGFMGPRFNLANVARPAPIQLLPFQAYTPSGVAARQFAFNAAVVGAGMSNIPPYAFGFPSPLLSAGGVAPISPFALSTFAGNPYATSATLSTSPYGSSSGYGLSTSGGGYGGGYGSGYGYQDPTGAALQGIASVTAATGQYYNQIQRARLLREQSRQAAIETQRKQIEFDLWYDTVRPTAPKLIRKQQENELDEARNYASSTRVWSGEALNQLLRSVVRSGKLNRGPNIGLEEDTLKHINLTDKSSRGNVGLLKDGVKLHWPQVLRGEDFEKPAKELEVTLRNAVEQIKELKKVSTTTLNDADALYKQLTNRLNDSADDLSPAEYIEARRYLNQVGQAVRALKDPKAANYFNNTWNAKGKTVAELVDHLRKEGLEFAPATSGDEAAYTALYNALRNFETGMQGSRNK
jgi:hypothetical protein